jgi:hypothetical protein
MNYAGGFAMDVLSYLDPIKLTLQGLYNISDAYFNKDSEKDKAKDPIDHIIQKPDPNWIPKTINKLPSADGRPQGRKNI